MKKILIVEDEPMIAQDIKAYLEEENFDVVGIAYNGKKALHLLPRLQPDAVILDISLKGDINGIAIAEFINTHDKQPFIFLTSHTDKTTFAQAKDTKPGGYILKPFEKNDVILALELAMANKEDEVLPSLEHLNRVLPTSLSEREYQLLSLIKQGRSNQEIADLLDISVNTVKSHLYKTFGKIDAKNRTDAIYKLEQF